MKCNYCFKNVNGATGLYATGTTYGSVCNSCYHKGLFKDKIHIHKDYKGNLCVDLQDCRILISKFCKRWHDPKKAFNDYFQLYIDTWFKQEHFKEYYLYGKWIIYKHDKNYLYFKWNIKYKDDNNKEYNIKYDLLAPYYDFLEFIICLETKQKINEILFNREQENLKPKILQRSLF